MRLLNALAIRVIVNGFPASTTRSSDEFSSRRTKSPLDIFNGGPLSFYTAEIRPFTCLMELFIMALLASAVIVITVEIEIEIKHLKGVV